MFKSKYFPNDTIFDAKKSSGSFAWKSILRARKVISMGAKWRIGDGLSIRVFSDNWIADAMGGRVISSALARDANMEVAELIDIGMGCWKSQKLMNAWYRLMPKGLRPFLCISLHNLISYTGHLKKNGLYSIKSGYQALCEEARSGEASGSNSGLIAGFWSSIWKLNVPGKVKHFMWKAC